eukprot:IDg14965t1
MASGFEVVGLILTLADFTLRAVTAIKGHIDASKQVVTYLERIHKQLKCISLKCAALGPDDAHSWLPIVQNLYKGADDLEHVKEYLEDINRKLSAPALSRWRFSRTAMAHDLDGMNARLSHLVEYLSLAKLIVHNTNALSKQICEGFANSSHALVAAALQPRARIRATVHLTHHDRALVARLTGEASDVPAFNADAMYCVGFRFKW